MPEHPRKLNDIKNKKEINDAINKIDKIIIYINCFNIIYLCKKEEYIYLIYLISLTLCQK